MSNRGKKSFVVEWSRDGLKIKVPVKIHVPCGEYMEDGKIYFSAEHKDSALNIRNENAEEIKTEILKHLNDWYSIDWELYILIEIGGGRGPGNEYRTKFDIELDMAYVVVGTHHNGDVVHMGVPEPKFEDIPKKAHVIWPLKTRWGGRNPVAGLPQVGETDRHNRARWGSNKDCMRALVPATQRIVSTIEVFFAKMDELLKNMRERFEPGNIIKTLKAIDSLKTLLLPPGEGEKNADL